MPALVGEQQGGVGVISIHIDALLNAVVHRDYDYSGSIIINIYDDRMEFISLGGLVKGLTLLDIKGGVSQPRNAVIILRRFPLPYVSMAAENLLV